MLRALHTPLAMAPLQLIIARDASHLAQTAAAWLCEKILAQPRFVLGCATGNSPLGLYRALTEKIHAEKISTAALHCFHLDEYLGMAAHDPRSFAAYVRQHVATPLGLHDAQIHYWRGDAANANAECVAYEAAIKRAGGIDCQLLGLGMNGHIAFNEPGSDPAGRCHVAQLATATLQHNAAALAGHTAPTHALTMGLGTIMDARTLLMLVSGAQKKLLLRELFTGSVRTDFPASIIRHHAATTIIADRAAVGSDVTKFQEITICEAP